MHGLEGASVMNSGTQRPQQSSGIQEPRGGVDEAKQARIARTKLQRSSGGEAMAWDANMSSTLAEHRHDDCLSHCQKDRVCAGVDPSRSRCSATCDSIHDVGPDPALTPRSRFRVLDTARHRPARPGDHVQCIAAFTVWTVAVSVQVVLGSIPGQVNEQGLDSVGGLAAPLALTNGRRPQCCRDDTKTTRRL